MMIVKRYMAFRNGKLRKRQYGAFIRKVNKHIVRITNARMQYLIAHTGLLSNALYRIKFAPPFVFKFINQLITQKNIMVNERLANYPSIFVVPGDKLEVVHTFWIKYTRPANFFIKFVKLKKYSKPKFFKKWKRHFNPRQRRRRFYPIIRKRREIKIQKILRAKKKNSLGSKNTTKKCV